AVSARTRYARRPEAAPGAPGSRLAGWRIRAASTGFTAGAAGTVTTPKGVAKIGTPCGAGLLIGAPRFRPPEAADPPGTRARARVPSRSDGRVPRGAWSAARDPAPRARAARPGPR